MRKNRTQNPRPVEATIRITFESQESCHNLNTPGFYTRMLNPTGRRSGSTSINDLPLTVEVVDVSINRAANVNS